MSKFQYTEQFSTKYLFQITLMICMFLTSLASNWCRYNLHIELNFIILIGRYFDEDDEPPTPALAYIPAPGSPTYEAACSSKVLVQIYQIKKK